MSEMPVQKPGASRQDYGTPPELLTAVKRLLQIEQFAWDLAADRSNTVVADKFYDIEANSLTQSWLFDGWGWCNEPFARLLPWVRKACEERERGAKSALLVPAGVGANWWRDYVHMRAQVHFLNGRVTFVGEVDPYPKDCAILLYGAYQPVGYHCWRWMDDVR